MVLTMYNYDHHMHTFIDALNWRYATKKYDSTKKLSDEQLNTLLESIRLAPMSYGLQAMSVVVVSNPAVRAKLRDASWGQPQLTDASHVLVFAVPTAVSKDDVERFMQDVVSTRGVTRESLDGYANMINDVISGRDTVANTTWVAKQAYIALGVLLSAAAVEGIDATPMEGFDPKQFDEILGLSAHGLTSVVICPIGFRIANDEYAQMKKVRQSSERLFVRI